MTHEEKTIFFEANYEIFNTEIEKRRRKWTLKAIPSIEFEDIKQILLRHLFIKIDLYDSSKSPLSHWTNTILSNQLSNLLRNLFYNHSRPCLKCACILPDNGCELYKEQTNKCPLYAIWEKGKKSANDIKLPLPICNHETEVFDLPSQEYNYEKAAEKLHQEMCKILKPHEWTVYKMMFIFFMTDAQIAKKMKWVSSEGRKPGYGNLARLKKIFLQKARKIKEEIDLF
ncbi:MAG: hypothetical protein Q7R95_02350 [bacterium]|nr:hypothetical protein [bacterium]